MKSRPEKAGYHILWNIQSSEILPSHDTSCMIFDADPKLIKGNHTTIFKICELFFFHTLIFFKNIQSFLNEKD